MKRFIKKVILMIVLCAVWGKCINFVMYNDVNAYTRIMMRELYQEKKIDILLLGSSHVYRSYDVEMMEQELQKNVFNAGSSSQSFRDSYYLLKDIIREREVEKVYLDTYVETGMMEEPDKKASYIVSDYMQMSLNKVQFLWEIDGIDAFVNDMFPAMHNRSLDVKKLLKEKMTDDYREGKYKYVTYENEEYRGQGFVYSFETMDATDDKILNPPLEINEKNPIGQNAYKYLEKIRKLCEENQIELILVSSPMPKQMLNNLENYQCYVDSIKDYSTKHALSYWNFNLCKEEKLKLNNDDFKDWNHLNGKGAEKYTAAFIELLKSYDIAELWFEERYDICRE